MDPRIGLVSALRWVLFLASPAALDRLVDFLDPRSLSALPRQQAEEAIDGVLPSSWAWVPTSSGPGLLSLLLLGHHITKRTPFDSAASACSWAWYELRTSGPDSTCRKPIASASRFM